MDPLLMNYVWLKCIIFFLSIFLINVVIVIVHEIGHGLCYTMFTGSRVTIWLGSYGNKNSWKFSLGTFDVNFKINVFTWKGGLCVPTVALKSPRQRFLFILAGPVASLFLSIVLFAIITALKPEGMSGLFFDIFFGCSFIVFLYNIIPVNRGFLTGSGRVGFNDGYLMLSMIRYNKMPLVYRDAVALFKEKKYTEAALIFDDMISAGTKQPDVYRMGIVTHINLRNYNQADRLQKEMIEKIGDINMNDRSNLALLKTVRGNYDEAIPYYYHLLQKDGDNITNLNNLGYTLTLVDRYEEAIDVLNKAVALNGKYAYAYCNRAYARMKMGCWENAKEDNDLSLSLDDSNAHAYRNAGLYYMETAQHQLALSAFEKARSLDDSLPSINSYISDAAWYVTNKKQREKEE